MYLLILTKNHQMTRILLIPNKYTFKSFGRNDLLKRLKIFSFEKQALFNYLSLILKDEYLFILRQFG